MCLRDHIEQRRGLFPRSVEQGAGSIDPAARDPFVPTRGIPCGAPPYSSREPRAGLRLRNGSPSDRARKAFRQSTASDQDKETFEALMGSDHDLAEGAALTRRLCSMGLEDAGNVFLNYVNKAHNTAVNYATSILTS